MPKIIGPAYPGRCNGTFYCTSKPVVMMRRVGTLIQDEVCTEYAMKALLEIMLDKDHPGVIFTPIEPREED
jgi:hypothetical protein